MESRRADALRLRCQPVALVRSNSPPEGEVQFQPAKWGCIMRLAAAAAKGQSAVCNRDSFVCFGGGVEIDSFPERPAWRRLAAEKDESPARSGGTP